MGEGEGRGGGKGGQSPLNAGEGPCGPEISVFTKILSAFISALRRVSAEHTKDSTTLSQSLTPLRGACAQECEYK